MELLRHVGFNLSAATVSNPSSFWRVAFDRRFNSDAHQRVLMHSPLAFDASTYELWVPLLRGGRVVIFPPGVLDLDTLQDVIGRHKVSGLWLTSY